MLLGQQDAGAVCCAGAPIGMGRSVCRGQRDAWATTATTATAIALQGRKGQLLFFREFNNVYRITRNTWHSAQHPDTHLRIVVDVRTQSTLSGNDFFRNLHKHMALSATLK
jgi:hypothetical protein